jgi:RecB family exonuclease
MAAHACQRRRVFSPQELNTYRTCPQQYFLRYVRKRKGRAFPRPGMTSGRVTHEVLAQAFKVYAGRRSFPAGLHREVEQRLPSDDFAGYAAWQQAVALIGGWVDYALETFDTSKVVHAVERAYRYAARGAQLPPFAVRSRIDLVVRLEDGSIEHIDWKTGRPHPADGLQAVASRIALGHSLKIARVRTTNSYLATGEVHSRIMPAEDAREGWGEIRAIVREIDAAHRSGEWPAHESKLCSYCEFFQHGCSRHRAALAGMDA